MPIATTETQEQKRGRGRPRTLSPEQEVQLIEHIKLNRQATQDELCIWLGETFSVSSDRLTVAKILKRHGISKRSAPRHAGVPDDRSSEQGSATGYPTSVTDAEWAKVQHLFTNQGAGKKPRCERRILLDAILYVVRGGVSWRMLPQGFPPWQNVYATFRRWVQKGTFEKYYDLLRDMARERAGRPVEPTAGVMDAQYTRTSPQGDPKGYDAGKKVSGRKRHLLVDTLGLLLAVLVTPASVQDRDAAAPVLALGKVKYPTLRKTLVDRGYAGAKTSAAAKVLGVDLEIVRSPHNGNGSWVGPALPFTPEMSKPFTVLPKRWVVERNNAWSERPRRMNRDHDRRVEVSTAWIWLLQGHRLHRQLMASGGGVKT